jgi:hypothetical protein
VCDRDVLEEDVELLGTGEEVIPDPSRDDLSVGNEFRG